jgi:hypothetical protein
VQKRKTYYEQIPVELAKKITDQPVPIEHRPAEKAVTEGDPSAIDITKP